MYRIGEFSKLCRTTLKTLRYYDEVGLLKPAFVDDDSGYRYYVDEQAAMLRRIQSLRQIGLSINEIQQVLDGSPEAKILESKRQALQREIYALVSRMNQIDFLLEGSDGKEPRYIPTLKVIPKLRALSVKLTLPDEESLLRYTDRVFYETYAANPQMRPVSPRYSFVTYLDTEYREKLIRIEYFEAVDADGEGCGDVRFKLLPEITALSVIHKGSYEELPAAYLFCYEWARKSGCTVIDRPRECYIDGPWNKSNPSQYRTELQVPILAAENNMTEI